MFFDGGKTRASEEVSPRNVWPRSHAAEAARERILVVFLTGNKPWIFLHTIFSFRRGNLIVCGVHILMPLHSDSFLRGIF